MNTVESDILKYERPALTADCVMLRTSMNLLTGQPCLQVRLVRRPNAPECGRLALIGAFVPVEERIDDVLSRCVADKAGIDEFYYEQLYTFDTPGRDERWRVISVAHIGIVEPDAPERFLRDADWYDIDIASRTVRSPVQETLCSFDDLAFDHGDILDCAIERLRGKALYTDIAFRFLSKTFTVSQLKRTLEVLAQKPVNNVKRDFGKYIEPAPVEDTKNKKNPPHRPSTLYRVKLEIIA